jgi:hypothetical protein
VEGGAGWGSSSSGVVGDRVRGMMVVMVVVVVGWWWWLGVREQVVSIVMWW